MKGSVMGERNHFLGPCFDPGTDEWTAILVYRDGNPIELGRFTTEEEAEAFCAEKTRAMLAERNKTDE